MRALPLVPATAVNQQAPADSDNFGTSNAASARAIADDDTVAISEDSKALAFSLGLTTPQPAINVKGTSARGYSDAIALVAAHHNHELHKKLQPQGVLQQQIFNEMERARCESLGGRKLAGSAFNIATLWNQQHDERLSTCRTEADRLLLAITTLTREILSISLASQQSPPAISAISQSLFDQHTALWQQLSVSTISQQSFAETAIRIISSIEDFSAKETPAAPSDSAISDNDEEAPATESQNSEETNEDDDTLSVSLREEDEQSSGDLVSVESADNENADASANRDAPVTTESEGGSAGIQNSSGGYRVFSTANDEVVRAVDLCQPDELVILRDLLDQHIHRHARVIGKLSGKLQRVLMAQQTRQWEFNLPEGTLDTARLTRVVTQPLASLSFKQESDSNFKDTSITLLVDNSKSMLGKPVAIAAACADILSQTLERCGVTVEILGFTTTELHRGPAYDRWQEQGAGEQPGRLNGLRHIIYKAADAPYRRSRMNFGVMLMKDLLKQNIDGESLLWAHNRLTRRPEKRKILIVISDGAPIDTSTMAANPQNYLVNHLHQVIANIESNSEVELLAIGIGHDVTKFYQRAMKIMDVKDLSSSLLSHMSELFSHGR